MKGKVLLDKEYKRASVYCKKLKNYNRFVLYEVEMEEIPGTVYMMMYSDEKGDSPSIIGYSTFTPEDAVIDALESRDRYAVDDLELSMFANEFVEAFSLREWYKETILELGRHIQIRENIEKKEHKRLEKEGYI